MVIIDKAHSAAYAGRVLESCFEVADKGTPGVILGRKAKAFERRMSGCRSEVEELPSRFQLRFISVPVSVLDVNAGVSARDHRVSPLRFVEVWRVNENCQPDHSGFPGAAG